MCYENFSYIPVKTGGKTEFLWDVEELMFLIIHTVLFPHKKQG